MAGYYEPDPAQPFEPMALLTGCIESGAGAVLLDEQTAPPAFFDLSTRLAGELIQKLGNYRIQLAVVVPDPSRHSQSFQDFAREANKGKAYRVFASRQEAIAWLES